MANTNVPSGSGSSITNVPNGSGASINNVGTLISVSSSSWTNIPSNAASGFTPNGSPIIWFSAQNIDASNNSTLIDGQSIGTWKNLGSLGSAADATQATAGLKPVFRLAPGGINGKSAVEFTLANASAMVTPTFTAQGTTCTYFALVKAKTSQAGGGFFCDGAGANRQQWGLISLQQRLFGGGGGAPTTGQTLTVSKWQSIGATFNGATSFTRMDGAQSANVDPTPITSLNLVELGAGAGGTSTFDGYIVEFVVYAGVQSPGTNEASLTSVYGATPQ